MLDDSGLAALALTSRVIDSAVEPLSSREFRVLRRITDPVALLGKSAVDVTSILDIGLDEAERIAKLLGRGTGLAIALERFANVGIWTLTDDDARYPAVLLQRLADAAPVVLHGVGDDSLLGLDGIGIVGSRKAGPEADDVARKLATAVSRADLPVISVAEKGVDQIAMNAAFDAGGKVIGVLADSLEQAIERPSTRRGITSGAICLVTQYAPSTSFSIGNALGRNKIVYGLSRCTVVIASDTNGRTWTGATEALKHQYTRVSCWTGAGAGVGNSSLIDLGAEPLSAVDHLTEFLAPERPAEQKKPGSEADQGQQLSLDF